MKEKKQKKSTTHGTIYTLLMLMLVMVTGLGCNEEKASIQGNILGPQKKGVSPNFNHAQDEDIHGNVKGSDTNSLDGVRVVCDNVSGCLDCESSKLCTDGSGYYCVTTPGTGTFDLSFRKFDYYKKIVPGISVGTDAKVPLDVTLTRLTSAARQRTIQGVINGTGVSGVTVKLFERDKCGAIDVHITCNDGEYTFPDLNDTIQYRVEPVRDGCTFNPSQVDILSFPITTTSYDFVISCS